MEYTQVNSKDLRNYGVMSRGTLYLQPGIHVRDRKPNSVNELFIKEREMNPTKRHIIN